MSITSDNFQISSSSPSGATVATDFINNNHYQIIKLNTGGDGTDSLLSHTAPVPVTHARSSEFFAVAGNTAGTIAVPIEICGGATLNVTSITLSGGTVDKIVGGVSSDIRSVGSSVVMGVKSVALNGITAQITGDVKLAAGANAIGSVSVSSVTIPTGGGFTTAAIAATAATASIANQTLPARQFSTGFRVTNFGPATVYLGNTYNTAYTGDTVAGGYPLQAFESLFVEATASDALMVATRTGTADVRIAGS